MGAANNRRLPRARRRHNDHYPTPLAVAQHALATIPKPHAGAVVLDPGAGTGVWGRVVRATWSGCRLIGVDLPCVAPAPEYDTWVSDDFIAWSRQQPGAWVDVVVGNPPYGDMAERFVWSSLHLLKAGGRLVFLLPLEFLGGQARGAGLYREAPPMRVLVSSRRIDFVGGSGDMRTHAIYTWRKGWSGDTTIGWFDYKSIAQQMPMIQIASATNNNA